MKTNIYFLVSFIIQSFIVYDIFKSLPLEILIYCFVILIAGNILFIIAFKTNNKRYYGDYY